MNWALNTRWEIREKGYALPFLKEDKEIILIGAAFSPATRRPDNRIIEPLH